MPPQYQYVVELFLAFLCESGWKYILWKETVPSAVSFKHYIFKMGKDGSAKRKFAQYNKLYDKVTQRNTWQNSFVHKSIMQESVISR